MPRLLLINPRFRPSFWTFSWVYEKVFTHMRYPVAPLGLASVAALTPEHWDIEIVDENVEEIDWDAPADVVGVAGMTTQYRRQRQILERFREKGRFVVAGGNHASLLPEDFEGLADTVVAGEAEYTWPRFCRDFEEGTPEALYRETGEVDLADSPTPRFDLLKLDRYSLAPVQFSRGCPFRCEFCDIIVVFGRKPRTKSNEQIGRELDALRAQGVNEVFFVDDNLIGHKPKARELLRFLVEYRRSHQFDIAFGTEASVNVAEDPELLELLRDAGFGWLFVGLESPNEASLEETLKFQNTRLDLLEAVRRIHAMGIAVRAGFIVGFDSDDETIFDRQYRFIQAAGIYAPMVGLLIAIPRTPLWTRLEAAGRLRAGVAVPEEKLMAGVSADNTGPWTDIEPLQMSYAQLIEGYADLMRRLFRERAIFQRLRNHIESLHSPLPKDTVNPETEVGFMWRLVLNGFVLGGPVRWYYLLRSLLLVRGDSARFWAIMEFWGTSITLKSFVGKTLSRSQVAASLADEESQAPGARSRDAAEAQSTL
jgi:radical SAM superfamily enzyme YgiQ (UPF0313 family)